MPRIIVTTEPSARRPEHDVLLDERIQSVHLSTGHAASQLIERLAWAIVDAEERESAAPASAASPSLRPRTRGSARVGRRWTVIAA